MRMPGLSQTSATIATSTMAPLKALLQSSTMSTSEKSAAPSKRIFEESEAATSANPAATNPIVGNSQNQPNTRMPFGPQVPSPVQHRGFVV